MFLQVLRDPSRPWGKDNYWIINPHSEYIFADGAFRRRRRRALKRGGGGGGGPAEDHPSPAPGYPPHPGPHPQHPGPPQGDPTGVASYHNNHPSNRPDVLKYLHQHILPSATAGITRYGNGPEFVPSGSDNSSSNRQDVLKPVSAFTIDNILKNSTDEHLKQWRDFHRSMDALRTHYHQQSLASARNGRSVIQFNPRGGGTGGVQFPIQQLLGHLPAYPTPLWPPMTIPSPSTGSGVLPPVNQAMYMEALNRWLLTTARLGGSLPAPPPGTPPSGQTCTDPQCNCAK